MKDVVRDQREAVDFINRCAPIFDGSPFHVELRPFKRPKSAEQRAKFHVLCREFAIKLRDEHGVDTSEEGVKYYMKDRHGPSKVVHGPSGLSIQKLKSSEEWSVDEASMMIDHLLRVAAEHEVVLE